MLSRRRGRRSCIPEPLDRLSSQAHLVDERDELLIHDDRSDLNMIRCKNLAL